MIKVISIIIFGYYFNVFVSLNKYLYENIAPFLPYPNTNHKQFTLLDASHSSIKDIENIVEIIIQHNPKLLIIDLFHKEKFLSETLLSKLDLRKVNFRLLSPNKFDKEHIINYQINELFEHKSFKKLPLMTDINIQREYYINYNGIPPLTKMYGVDVLKKNFVPNFFTNKTIIISNFDNVYAISSFSTLYGEEFVHESTLAFMFKSSLSDSWLFTLTEIEYLVFLVLSIIFWIIINHYLSSRFVLLVSFSIIFPIIAYYFFVVYINLLIPISELIVISILSSYLLARHLVTLKQEEESSILINISRRIQENVLHKTFFNSDKYWKDLITLIEQLFNMKKIILFEKVVGDIRIKEIVSYQSSFEDIGEMRRDYTREPYRSAIKNKGVTLSSRRIFKSLDENEIEFLVPLSHENEVVGFWVFTLEEKERERITNFETIINNSADEISKLVFQRNKFIKTKEKSTTSKIKNILEMDIHDTNIFELKNSLAIIEKRMLLTEIIFDNMYSHTIIYNLFGKIVQINERMNVILQDEKIMAYTLTAGDMLSSLTNLSVVEAKEIVREVTFNQVEHKSFITLKNNHKKYILIVTALSQEKISNKFSENYIFGTYGILFELIDFDFIQKSINLKEDLINHVVINSNKLLMNLENLSPLESKNILECTLNSIMSSCKKLTAFMAQDLEKEGELYPVDLQYHIASLSDRITKEYLNQRIKVNTEKIYNLPLVLVSVKTLEKSIYSLLNFMALDSEEDSALEIKFRIEKKYVVISIQNSGFGLPQDELDGYLSSPDSTSEYNVLKQTRESILSWEGDVIFSSQLGYGIKIEIFLKMIEL